MKAALLVGLSAVVALSLIVNVPQHGVVRNPSLIESLTAAQQRALRY